jgi:hypothetical protein
MAVVEAVALMAEHRAKAVMVVGAQVAQIVQTELLAQQTLVAVVVVLVADRVDRAEQVDQVLLF